jgi:hypothetical protein
MQWNRILFTFYDLSAFFNKSEQSISQQLRQSKEVKAINDQSKIISYDIVSEIRNIILENYEKYTVLCSYLTDLLQYNDNIILQLDTIQHIYRNIDDIKPIRRVSIDSRWIDANPDDIIG